MSKGSIKIIGKTKRVQIFLLSALLLATASWAQATDRIEEGSIFYPTLISAQYKNGVIEVRFEPLKEEGILYKVYRSSIPIHNEAILATSTLFKDLTEDQLPVIDVPEKDGRYFYAVTAVKGKREYLQLVPYQNSTVGAVEFSPFPEQAANIDIKATEGNRIEIYFQQKRADKADDNGRFSYRLYSSTSMIQNLQNQKPVDVIDRANIPFTLTVKENTPYFFVITSVNRLNVENRKIIIGENQNSKPFIIKKTAKETAQPIRAQPKENPKRLIEKNLRYNFYRGKYESALKTFFVLLRRDSVSEDQKALAHFYIGQCYFYLGNIPKAIKYFILSKEVKTYTAMADAWIERSLHTE